MPSDELAVFGKVYFIKYCLCICNHIGNVNKYVIIIIVNKRVLNKLKKPILRE